MRRKGIDILIISLFTLIIILTGGYLIRRYLQKTSDELVVRLDKINSYVDSGQWENARIEISDMDKDWSSKEKVWGIVINHHEIDNISISLKSSMVYIDKENEIYSLSSLSSLRHYISHIPLMERTNFMNVF